MLMRARVEGCCDDGADAGACGKRDTVSETSQVVGEFKCVLRERDLLAPLRMFSAPDARANAASLRWLHCPQRQHLSSSSTHTHTHQYSMNNSDTTPVSAFRGHILASPSFPYPSTPIHFPTTLVLLLLPPPFCCSYRAESCHTRQLSSGFSCSLT